MQPWPITGVSLVNSIAITVSRIADATAIVVGDWGVAGCAQALEVARVHLQSWVVVALDDVMHLLSEKLREAPLLQVFAGQDAGLWGYSSAQQR